MQAIILFAMFGALMAAVAGIVSTGVDTTQQFTLSQVRQMREYFENAKRVVTDLTVERNMQTPYAVCPDGTTYQSSDPRAYLCQTDIAQLAQWTGAQQGVKDPWKSDLTGYVVRKEVAIYAQAPNNYVVVPVTAMVLVSPGPDRRIDTQLQTDLAALGSTSTIRDVLRISHRDQSPGSCSPTATVSCDDIVYTFSDERAQDNRWKSVQDAVGRIASGALRFYQVQFLQFLPQLQGIYNSNSGALFDSSGNLVINTENMNLWKNQGAAGTPSFATVNLNSSTERTAIGVDEEFRYITNSLPTGGSGLTMTFGVGNSAYGTNDVLNITVNNGTSPWGHNGTLSFKQSVDSSQLTN